MFEWDENKNQANIRKHGVSFEQAVRIFEGPCLTWIDDRDIYSEMREVSIGMIDGAATVIVVHADRNNITRIISARAANRRERRRYAKEIFGTDDA